MTEGKYEAIVAGAGIWGCTVARRLAEAGRRVLVLERRKAVGGNVRCKTIDNIEVHLYGSHIFHTSDEGVWRFVNRFTSFNGYRHTVQAQYNGARYSLPLGLTLVNQFYGISLKPGEMAAFIQREIARETEVLADPERNFETKAISLIGRPLYEAFIRGYTEKQWGVRATELSADIIRRLPVRDNFDVSYFNDPHQGIPTDGYNAFFDRLLDHPNIRVRCNASFDLKDLAAQAAAGVRAVYYSGPLDRLFGYRHGHLPWRSLRFETEQLAQNDFQGTTVVNYTERSVPYTRIHEFRHYHPEGFAGATKVRGTIITREYPAEWKSGDEPYYPVDTADSRALVARYRAETDETNARLAKMAGSALRLVVGGRLGAYKYYDMDKSIADALAVELF